MKIYITAFVLMAFMASCDYSNSSNGNIDAAFAREVKTEETGHGAHEGHDAHGAHDDLSGGEQIKGEEKSHPGENTDHDVYDTTAQEHKTQPEGIVVATDTNQIEKKGNNIDKSKFKSKTKKQKK